MMRAYVRLGMGIVGLSFLALNVMAAGKVAKDAPTTKQPASVSDTTTTASPGRVTLAARIVWLDKQTNRKMDVVVQRDSPQTLGGLEVSLIKCAPDVQGRPLQDAAWLEVREPNREAAWFEGWMFNAFPDVATLEHPRYDMMLVGCGVEPRAKPARAVSPTVASDGGSGYDSEAAGASEAPAGDDPYYVPGLENKNEAVSASTSVVESAKGFVSETLPVRAVHEESKPAAEQNEPKKADTPEDQLQKMMDGVY